MCWSLVAARYSSVCRNAPRRRALNSAQSLFKHRRAERVIAVELPKHRSCMHLDTVMTHIDIDTFSVYPEVVRPDVQCWTLTPDGRGGLKRTRKVLWYMPSKKRWASTKSS